MKNEIKWLADPSHNEIAFSVRHLMISSVRGIFKKFDISVYTTTKDFLDADIEVWVDPSSISTGDTKRDEHLKSADFFDVETYKQISFTSNAIRKNGHANSYELWGVLTMKSMSNTIKLNVEFGGISKDTFGNEKAGFAITGKIKRSDWDLTWNAVLEGGGMMVSDEVAIQCNIELTNSGSSDGEFVMENAEETEDVKSKNN